MTSAEERRVVAELLSGRLRLRDVKSRSCDDFSDAHMRAAFAIATSWLECGARPSPERLARVAESIGVGWPDMAGDLALLAAGGT